jgi:nicotinamidase/pyrazinamidase
MSGAGEATVFFDVDTQVDFMCAGGKLYVPGAEQIAPNLQRLMACARLNDVPVISTADAHAPDDPEFKTWPPHCVAGTPGQRRVPETTTPGPVVIPSRPHSFQPPAHWAGQFVLEKTTYAAQANPNFDAVMHALGRRHAVVFGVATEYCVRALTLDLCRRGLQVDLVVDAIKAITPERGERALAEMAAAGAHLVTTAQVCSHAAP